MVDQFPAMYEEQWLAGMRRKLGLEGSQAGDLELVQELLDWMHGERADFTSTFRDLCELLFLMGRSIGNQLSGVVRQMAASPRTKSPWNGICAAVDGEFQSGGHSTKSSGRGSLASRERPCGSFEDSSLAGSFDRSVCGIGEQSSVPPGSAFLFRSLSDLLWYLSSVWPSA